VEIGISATVLEEEGKEGKRNGRFEFFRKQRRLRVAWRKSALKGESTLLFWLVGREEREGKLPTTADKTESGTKENAMKRNQEFKVKGKGRADRTTKWR